MATLTAVPATPASEVAPTRRIASLDSLRGLAALSVVLWHIISIFPVASSGWLMLTPLRILVDGEGAVMVFFALSGFVLMLPYLGAHPPRYEQFLKKRVLRIYPACWVVLTFSVVAYYSIGRNLPAGVSPTRMPLWYAPPNAIVLTFQFLLIGGTVTLTPVLWTLFLEMRISLFYPIIARFAREHSWTLILPGTLAMYSVAAWLIAGRPLGLIYEALLTIECAGLFVCGALAAKHRAELRRRFASMRTPAKYVVLLSMLLLYLIGLPLRGSAIGTAIVSVVAVLVVTSAAASSKLDSLLSRAPLIWLGKISYSLYLIHFVIFGSLVYALDGRVPLWVSVLPVLPLSLLTAALLQRFVEAPFIRVSHKRA